MARKKLYEKYHVPVELLMNMFPIFKGQFLDCVLDNDVWGTETSIQTIFEAIAERRYVENSYSASIAPTVEMDTDKQYDHSARIAYLVEHKDETPINLDVSIPSLGYYRDCLLDGYHRLSAAFIRGDEYIACTFGGSVDYFYEVFKPLEGEKACMT